jgi:hypothetical protein
VQYLTIQELILRQKCNTLEPAERRDNACKDSWELQNSSPTPTIGALSPVELKPAIGIFNVLIQIQKQNSLYLWMAMYMVYWEIKKERWTVMFITSTSINKAKKITSHLNWTQYLSLFWREKNRQQIKYQVIYYFTWFWGKINSKYQVSFLSPS